MNVNVSFDEQRNQMDTALTAVETIFPGYDPFKGHRPGDHANKSTFSFDGTAMEMLDKVWTKLMPTPSIAKPDENTVIMTYMVAPSEDAGTEVLTSLIPDAVYTIDTPHGDYLQARGPVTTASVKAKYVSFVLTLENAAEGKVWCLASVYPGKPDAPGDWTGLKAGDEVLGKDLIARGITRAHA
jgi:hypothetical protein